MAKGCYCYYLWFFVALFNYFSSKKQRQDQAMELSYTTNILSILEFKKDIGQKNISILYGEDYELADLYLISCDIENTDRKVIKNQEITFEFLSTNVGILEQFFEPPLNDNLMGIEEIEIENIKQAEVKKRYLIREILPKHQVGFQFLSGRRTQENEEPKLFVSNQDSSKVELIPKTYKGERDEISRIMNFVTFLILFFTEILWFKASPFKGIINNNFPFRQSYLFQGEVILNSQFSIVELVVLIKNGDILMLLI
ncbi:hypothetical protein ACP6PL_18130 [Dapis sp. BLCC M126]